MCPAKAGVFNGKAQTRRGNSQKPRSLDSRVAGDQDPEAYRQCHLEDGSESPGRNESERIGGLENPIPEAEPAPDGRRQHGQRKAGIDG